MSCSIEVSMIKSLPSIYILNILNFGKSIVDCEYDYMGKSMCTWRYSRKIRLRRLGKAMRKLIMDNRETEASGRNGHVVIFIGLFLSNSIPKAFPRSKLIWAIKCNLTTDLNSDNIILPLLLYMVLYLPLKLIFQDIKLLYLFYTYLMLVTLLFTKIYLDGFPKYSRSSTLASVIKINLFYYMLSFVVQICGDALRWGFIFQWLSAFFSAAHGQIK